MTVWVVGVREHLPTTQKSRPHRTHPTTSCLLIMQWHHLLSSMLGAHYQQLMLLMLHLVGLDVAIMVLDGPGAISIELLQPTPVPPTFLGPEDL